MNIISYLSDHLGLIGWPTLIALAWKTSRYISKVEGRIETAESTIGLVATNHLPHIQSGIDTISDGLDKGIDRLARSMDNLGTQILILASKKND